MKRIFSTACALLLCLAVLPASASADMGPKPTLTILIKNAPSEPYYLDLLLPEDEYKPYDNLGDRPYDSILLDGLHAWEGQGWYPALAGGTGVPLFGDLTPGADGAHRFTYFGLPDTFRIAVVSRSGCVVDLKATDAPYTRTAFFTTLTYDCAANTIVEGTSGWAARLVELLFTLIPTLAIEGLLLLLFGFKLRENWLVFLAVNLVTQVGLHLAVGDLLLSSSSFFALYLFTLIPAEAVIWTAEALAFALLLRGGTRKRRVAYALTANAASFAAGFFALAPMIGLLKRL